MFTPQPPPANTTSSASIPKKKSATTTSATALSAWEAAPTAHQRLLDDARRALSSYESEKRILVIPPTAPRHISSATASRVLKPPKTIEGQIAQIESNESEQRVHLLARESWEREVVCQCARVELIASVIKPHVDRICGDERQRRADIRLEEAEAFAVIRDSDLGLHHSAKVQMSQRRTERLRTQASGTPARPASSEDHLHDEAERILERYRQLHLQRGTETPTVRSTRPSSCVMEATTPATVSKQVHSAVVTPAPPSSVKRGFHVPSTLDLATAVHLQNQNIYFRRMIEETEADSFADLLQHFGNELVKVEVLVRKRQHLERLVYWRSEREKEVAREQRLAELRGLAKELADTETELRLRIEGEEDECGADLWTAEFFSYCYVQQWQVAKAEAQQRLGVAAEYAASTAVCIVQHHEQLRRSMIEFEFVRSAETSIVPAQSTLRELEHFSRGVRKNCVAIQRWYRKLRLGLIGNRRSHKLIGEAIRQKRSNQQMRSTRDTIVKYQQDLAKEVAAAWEEINQSLIAEQLKLFDGENYARLDIATQDGWFRAGFKRRFQTEIIHNMIMPKFAIIDQDERKQRDTIEIYEEADVRDELGAWHVQQVALIKVRIAVRDFDEPTERDSLLCSEHEAFLHLQQAVHASHANVVARQADHTAKQLAERQALEDLAEQTILVDVFDEFTSGLQHLFHRQKLDILQVFALSHRLSGRQRVWQEFMKGFVVLCTEFLEWSHAFEGRQLLSESKSQSREHHFQHLWAQANIDKMSLFTAEVAMWETAVRPECDAEKEAIERRVERRHRGSITIQRFFRNYQLGKVGRSGLKAFLRRVFEEKRTRAELRRKMEEQRDDVESLRRELAQEIAKHNLLTIESYRSLFEHIDNKLEPRQRNSISSHENFVWHIMKRNFDFQTVEIVKENMAELRQHEAYRRTEIMLQWDREYKNKILPRQLVFFQDVKVRPLQRAWRCHQARQARRARTDQLVVNLPNIESRERHELVMQEMQEWAVTVAHPGAWERLYRLDYCEGLQRTVAIQYEAFDITATSIIAEEWDRRLTLLWGLQQAVRYRSIEQQEADARRTLTTVTLSAGIAKAELYDDEIAHRKALDHERFLFLLRILSQLEAVSRAYEGKTFLGALQQTVVTTAEPVYRAFVEVAFVASLMWPLQHYETNQRFSMMHEEEAVRQRLALEIEESHQRVDHEDRQHSLRNWFQWAIDVQQLREKDMLYREEVRERAALGVTFNEGLDRHKIWKEWLLRMSHPSFFSPKGVVSYSPPYMYACEAQEEDMRRKVLLQQELLDFWNDMRRQRDAAFAHYLTATARNVVAGA